MQAKMIVNRLNDWFQIKDVELDTCNLAMNILERLNRRTVVGYDYDRIDLAQKILNRKSIETVKAIDDAICVLISRHLIKFEDKSYGKKKILITGLGIEAVKEYEGLI